MDGFTVLLAVVFALAVLGVAAAIVGVDTREQFDDVHLQGHAR